MNNTHIYIHIHTYIYILLYMYVHILSRAHTYHAIMYTSALWFPLTKQRHNVTSSPHRSGKNPRFSTLWALRETHNTASGRAATCLLDPPRGGVSTSVMGMQSTNPLNPQENGDIWLEGIYMNLHKLPIGLPANRMGSGKFWPGTVRWDSSLRLGESEWACAT